MTRYIDADAFIKRLKEHIYINARIDGDSSIGKTLATVIDEMNAFPSANVKEVKHGKWTFVDGHITCTICKSQPYKDHSRIDFSNLYEYCPYCGAKMYE